MLDVLYALSFVCCCFAAAEVRSWMRIRIRIRKLERPCRISQYKDTYLESIMYPKTDIAKLDKKIKDTVDTYQKHFLEAVKPYKEKRKAEFI